MTIIITIRAGADAQMSRPSNPFNDASRVPRHDVVNGLQILTLTAELLAIELRDGTRTGEQIQERGQALRDANQRVVEAAQRLPTRQVKADETGVDSLAESESVQEIRAFVGFITHYATLPDVEWDVLAEYVDALHNQAEALIYLIDQPDS